MALITFDEYFAKTNGKYIDYDGKYGVTCFDLANDYCEKVLGGKQFIGMGAWEIYENFDNQPNKGLFERIKNTPDFVPQKGDIIVWSKTLNGDWGHVEVCTGNGDTTWFESYGQNWTGNHDACTLISHNYNHVLGVLRAKDQSMIIGNKEAKEVNKIATTYKGIDISRYQGNPDFSRVKNAVNFVILQAGYGRYSSQKDTSFERSYSECKKYGIPIGAYWYSYAKTAAEALAEARACLEVIKGKQFEYPIYYDLEESLESLGKNLVSSIATTFCNALEEAGYFAGIYMSRSPAQLYLTDGVANRYALWLAEYNSKLNWNGSVGMWQYSSVGKVSGILGDVDMNECYIDYSAIIKTIGLNGFPKSSSPSSDKTILDDKGYKNGDKGYQALAIKELLRLAIDKGIVSGKLDSTSGLGDGSIKIVNTLLNKWGYKQNGVAGTNFIIKLYEELR